jgi:NADH:ubiquinone oxidoreductase subunit 4 (subunit M)
MAILTLMLGLETRMIGLTVSIFAASAVILGMSFSDMTALSSPVVSNLNLGSISQAFMYLTVFIMPVCLMASYGNIVHNYKAYIALLLSLELILLYLFSTGDIIGFYVGFEMALLPLYVLVGCYGASSNRLRASLLL